MEKALKNLGFVWTGHWLNVLINIIFWIFCIIYLRNDLQIDLSLDKLKSQPRYPFEYEFTNNKFLD